MKKILIVDDSTFMRTLLKKILVKHGFQIVGEARNGKEAVEQYKLLSPDVVTLDITLDEMDGVQVLKEIVKYDKNAKVVMVSAMSQEPIVREAIASGAKGFIVKPPDEDSVVFSILNCFEN